jgi:hypothetical protein
MSVKRLFDDDKHEQGRGNNIGWLWRGRHN